MPVPRTPPVPQDSDSQAVIVPSFLAPTLTRAKAEGRVPATINSASRSSMILTGLPSAIFEMLGVLDAPAVDGELAAESAADVVHLHVDIVGGNRQSLRQLTADTRYSLRRGMDERPSRLPIRLSARAIPGSSAP